MRRRKPPSLEQLADRLTLGGGVADTLEQAGYDPLVIAELGAQAARRLLANHGDLSDSRQRDLHAIGVALFTAGFAIGTGGRR